CRAKSHELREVVIQTGSNDATLFCRFAESDESTARPIGAAYGVRVDGTYPDYQRVVPQDFTDKGAPGFQGRYIAAFGDLACELAAHIGRKPSKHDDSPGRSDVLRVFCGDSKHPEGSPALIIFPAVELAFGILMPCRVAADFKPDVPAWFRAPVAPDLAPAAAELATENA
ncbi:MAG: hypothetical protein ACXWLO_04605, partial [Rhizomicrobium sp.]